MRKFVSQFFHSVHHVTALRTKINDIANKTEHWIGDLISPNHTVDLLKDFFQEICPPIQVSDHEMCLERRQAFALPNRLRLRHSIRLSLKKRFQIHFVRLSDYCSARLSVSITRKASKTDVTEPYVTSNRSRSVRRNAPRLTQPTNSAS